MTSTDGYQDHDVTSDFTSRQAPQVLGMSMSTWTSWSAHAIKRCSSVSHEVQAAFSGIQILQLLARRQRTKSCGSGTDTGRSKHLHPRSPRSPSSPTARPAASN